MEIKAVAGDRENSYGCQGTTRKSKINAAEFGNMGAEILSG